jgi:threonylcarbamoyladenosine tRNA methylthiotransferase MtaB
MLTILSQKKRRHFYNENMGRRREVLFEGSREAGRMSGFTDNYIKIDTDIDLDLINQLGVVQLMAVNEKGNVDVVRMDIPEGIFEIV